MDYAGFWLRVAAYLIDTIILYVVQMVFVMTLGLSMIPAAHVLSDEVAGGLFVGLYVVMFVLGVLYFVIMESSAKQATLGKMILGLTVTDMAGGRITFLRALGRYFAKFVSALILCIGFVMAGFTERKQGLHDLMCGTLVVKAKPGEAAVDAGVFA
ncbi:RDD family protein [Tsuneonella sp. HG094]